MTLRTFSSTVATVALIMVGLLYFAPAGCRAAPDAGRSSPDDGTIVVARVPVTELFSVDGCHVYRFTDSGAVHYLATTTWTSNSNARCALGR